MVSRRPTQKVVRSGPRCVPRFPNVLPQPAPLPWFSREIADSSDISCGKATVALRRA
jgi:hypothetical protein